MSPEVRKWGSGVTTRASPRTGVHRVPLSELNLGDYDLLDANAVVDDEMMRRDMDSFYMVTRDLNTCAPNVVPGEYPLPPFFGEEILFKEDKRMLLRLLEEEFAERGESLANVRAGLLAALKRSPFDSDLHRAVACLVQREVYNHSFAGYPYLGDGGGLHSYQETVYYPPRVENIDFENSLWWPGFAKNDAIVSLFFVNRLREEVPNFLYTYAVTPSYEGRGYLNVYKIVEPLPRISLPQWFKRGGAQRVEGRHSPLLRSVFEREARNIALQVLLALTVAHRRFRFVHNSLSSKFVSVHALPEPRHIVYDTGARRYALVANNIAVIEDCDLAHVELMTDEVQEGAPNYDARRGVLHTGTGGSHRDSAPATARILVDFMFFLATWALDMETELRDGSAIAWALGPAFRGERPSAEQLRAWVNLDVPIPPDLEIDPLEYIEALLRSDPGLAEEMVAASTGEGATIRPICLKSGSGGRKVKKISPYLNSITRQPPSAPEPFDFPSTDVSYVESYIKRVKAKREALERTEANVTPEYDGIEKGTLKWVDLVFGRDSSRRATAQRTNAQIGVRRYIKNLISMEWVFGPVNTTSRALGPRLSSPQEKTPPALRLFGLFLKCELMLDRVYRFTAGMRPRT